LELRMSFETTVVGLVVIPSTSKPVKIRPESVIYSTHETPHSDVELFMGRLNSNLLDCAMCAHRAKDAVQAVAVVKESEFVAVTRSVALAVCRRCRKSGDADSVVGQLVKNWQVSERKPSEN
jgi:hypothetical protein